MLLQGLGLPDTKEQIKEYITDGKPFTFSDKKC
jgi:hypothetical protein